MKIGLVCPYSINKHGGVLEVVLALQAGLEAKGRRVKLITPRPRGDIEGDQSKMIFIGNSTDFRAPSRTTAQVSSITLNETIDAMLAKEKFDILHFHEPWVPLLSRQLLQRSRSVNIATFHSKIPETLMARTVIKVVNPYLKSVMQYLHVLTAVSDSGAEYAAGMTDQPITIIPNGINLEKYQQAQKRRKASSGQNILYVGRLEGRKGVKYLLQAFQLLQQDNPDVKLTIAGDGPEREKLELLTEDLQLKNVEFLGFISEDLKLELLQQTDLFCSPAIFGESFGIVLLEAMASGAVTIAGNNSGYIDLMKDAGMLSIVNPADTPEFARRLDMMLNQPALRKVWQKWAYEYVEQFNYFHVIDKYEELYIDALQQYKNR